MFYFYDFSKTRSYTENIENNNNALKTNELALNKAKLVLEEKNQKLEELNLKLKTKNQQIEEFTKVVTHDLKTPLNNITLITEELEINTEHGNHEDTLSYLKHLKGSCHRMDELVTGLNQYAEIGNQPRFTNVDCSQIIQFALEDMSQQIKKTQAQISIGNMPSIIADEKEIRMVFQNLIHNAIKFMPNGKTPKITITSEQKNGSYLFCVKDNGIGIPIQQQKNVFEAFIRLNGKQNYEGSGIGLFGCKKVINLHKGEIWIESKKDQGSSFLFTVSAELEEALLV